MSELSETEAVAPKLQDPRSEDSEELTEVDTCSSTELDTELDTVQVDTTATESDTQSDESKPNAVRRWVDAFLLTQKAVVRGFKVF